MDKGTFVTLLQHSQLMLTLQTVLKGSGTSTVELYLAFISQLGQRNSLYYIIMWKDQQEKLKELFSPTLQFKSKKLHSVRSPAIRVQLIKPLVVDKGSTNFVINAQTLHLIF